MVLAATVGLNACGMVESDPNRFENLANSVAAIDLDGKRAAAAPRTAAEAGLRPALRVEVMEPHALWDARDGLDTAVQHAAVAAAPVVADAVVQQVSDRIDAASSRAGLRPAMDTRPTPSRSAPAPRAGRGLVQLGAYSSEAAARSAWSRLKSGEAAWALNGLSPVYEPVEVGGRRLTRLKVAAPVAGAAAVCAAAGIDDPWCNRVA